MSLRALVAVAWFTMMLAALVTFRLPAPPRPPAGSYVGTYEAP